MNMVKINPQPIIEKFGRATQIEIAAAVGVTRPTVAKWLSGEMKTVDLEVLSKLVAVCGVQPCDFFITEDIRANGETL